MFYFLSPNVLLVFVFKIAKLNVFFFLRNCVVYLVIKLPKALHINLIYLYILENVTFLANKGNILLKLKHVANVVIIPKKKVFIILVVAVCTFC